MIWLEKERMAWTQSHRRLIARRRKEKNWSQGELTERLHVTDKAVSRWETGRGLPDENPWALGLA